MAKKKYYSLDAINSKECQYNIIFGERSNGKTFACLEMILKNYVNTGKQGAYIRRYREDFIGKRGQQMFAGIVSAGLVEKYTKGEYTDIYYNSSRWYLSRYDEDLDKRILSEEPICYAFSIASMEHDKSTSYPDITTIVFDEFLTRDGYLSDEFVLFMNVVSTIVRDRLDVKIYMCGNTVNKFSPYFAEMGLNHVKDMKQGTIDVYTYGKSSLKVAVEYADSPNKKGKDSDVYFAFNNPKLQMITSGVWEVDLYPHCPLKFIPKEIVFMYFIVWEEYTLQCEVVLHNNNYFTYIHRKTTPIKDEEKDIVYSTLVSSKPNYKRKITKPTSKLEEKILWFYKAEKIFYQDNTIGEVVRNYLQWCNT